MIGHKGPGASATQYSDSYANQEHWASSPTEDREQDDDNGIGDQDGLLEQVGGLIGGGMA
ncbi:hypothetical protein [Bradyrhizobium sp. 6(2017)]|uniref:hypothetical protein n=1 Tax=Bradyrhizobium sp. 6(2017) TaxID=1197460 RepID=UPI0013E168E2|nr:hypothetical protein [Bradyrhizobium sp. 6(2017)]QIG92084.1 hypothetical protein G6P99_05915 [Bradyrhizobium sp. 6(2017)]